MRRAGTCKTPILVIMFNRPEQTRRVVEHVGRSRPPHLLLAADGPRESHPEDIQRCAEARQAALDAVDWPCTVDTLFSDTNMGCRRRVSSAMDWAFGQVDRAVVVEDDCLLSPDFLRLCDDLLERYKNDLRVGHIGAYNMQRGRTTTPDSYYFSRYAHCWGWATWADRWLDCYDHELATWPEVREAGDLMCQFTAPEEQAFWRNTLDAIHAGQIDSWAYIWTYTNFIHNRLAVVPRVNMVQNIGFGADATHTTNADAQDAQLAAAPMPEPFQHPDLMIRNVQADQHVARAHYWLRRNRKRFWRRSRR